MSKSLDVRVSKLERSVKAEELIFVRTLRANGEIVPLRPGQRYASYVAELPEVCATTEEWAKQYAPQ